MNNITSIKIGIISILIGTVVVITNHARAQEVGDIDSKIYITPLFEYPSAPEELPDLQTKSAWLMDHFWDNLEIKKNQSVDQNALNDAFQVYAAAAVYAPRDKVASSINNLLKSAKGNPVMVLQLTKGAEEVFYGPRAVIWSDEIYLPFLKTVMEEKGISETRKFKYQNQLNLLKKNAIGQKFSELRLTLRDGKHHVFKPETGLTIIEIGDPECDDCKFSKMKLEMASDLMQMVEDKQLEILFLVADAIPEDEPEILRAFKSYPSNWITGISYGADEKLDIRATPTFYILGKKGEILAKNLDVNSAVERVRILKAQSDNKTKK